MQLVAAARSLGPSSRHPGSENVLALRAGLVSPTTADWSMVWAQTRHGVRSLTPPTPPVGKMEQARGLWAAGSQDTVAFQRDIFDEMVGAGKILAVF